MEINLNKRSEISLRTIKANCEITPLPERESSCWLWKGSTHNGSPCIKLKSKRLFLRRVVYWLTHGGFQSRAKVKTTCGKQHCLNPEHLTTKLKSTVSFTEAIEEGLSETST